MKTLTIFTPTYNRAYCLEQCYNSLIRQSCMDFEWLIVDDGSTDETEKLVQGWIESNKNIIIKYIRQDNKGKQAAHNRAVEYCDTELFFCVDSDDYLTYNAVENVIKIWAQEKYNDNVAGIIALRGINDNSPLGTFMPENTMYSTLMRLYEKYNFKGDTALIYRTQILKKYPFELEDNEKFIGENFVYDRIDQKYTMRLYNSIIYICKYQEDGYTRNTVQLLKKNPKSYMKMKKQSARLSKSLPFKLKHMGGYIAMAIFQKEKNIIKNSGAPLLAILCLPIGIIIYYYRLKAR